MAALTGLRRRAAGPVGALLAGLLSLSLGGCANPFQPATPEPPDASSLRADYSTPTRLLRTLEAAMKNKGPAGAVAWIDAMASPTGPAAPGFTSVHDPIMLDRWAASSTVPPPDPWNYELERTFYSTFIERMYPGYEFEVSMLEVDEANSVSEDLDESDNVVLLHRKYFIAAILPDEAKVIAIGIADLTLVKYDGNWHIQQWKDRIDPQIGMDPTTEVVPLGWRRLEFH